MPVRATTAEQSLVGADWTSPAARAAAMAAAGAEAAASVTPPTDSNGTTEYRRDLVQVMVERAALTGAAP